MLQHFVQKFASLSPLKLLNTVLCIFCYPHP